MINNLRVKKIGFGPFARKFSVKYDFLARFLSKNKIKLFNRENNVVGDILNLFFQK